MNKEKIYSISFILTNLILWPINANISHEVYNHYDDLLVGEPLPGLTEIMQGKKNIWPFVFIAMFIFAYYKASKEENKSIHIILITALVEMAFITIVGVAYFMPYTMITINM